MGRRGPLPNVARAKGVAARPGRARPVPEPDAELPAHLVERWHVAWSAPVARSWGPEVEPTVRRLWRLYDVWEQALAAVAAGGLTSTGSKGQQTVSPTFIALQRTEQLISTLERQLGLTPQAQAQLGTAAAEAALSWRELAQGSETAAPASASRATESKADELEADEPEVLDVDAFVGGGDEGD